MNTKPERTLLFHLLVFTGCVCCESFLIGWFDRPVFYGGATLSLIAAFLTAFAYARWLLLNIFKGVKNETEVPK